MAVGTKCCGRVWGCGFCPQCGRSLHNETPEESDLDGIYAKESAFDRGYWDAYNGVRSKVGNEDHPQAKKLYRQGWKVLKQEMRQEDESCHKSS